MYFKIIKKDLKRNKSMNIILFIFILLTTMLIASSINMMVTFSNALDDFIKAANVGDFNVFTYYDAKQDAKIQEWAGQNTEIKSYHRDTYLYLDYQKASFKNKKKETGSNTTFLIDYDGKSYNRFFNEKDELVELNDNEIGIPVSFHNSTNLNIGDYFTVQMGDSKKTFKVACYVKDAMCGSSIMSIKRFVVNKQDYELLSGLDSSRQVQYTFFVKDTSRIIEFDKEFNGQMYNSISTFERSTVKSAYLVDLLMAALMVLVSIFLIIIAFLILRFTIVYTLQEDYRQIGIMKAIGLKNKGIKKLYMVKYAFLSLAGGFIGLFLSFPFQHELSRSVAQNIIIRNSKYSLLINICAALAVAMINLSFCSQCTRKLNRISAIQSIRNGNSGERFRKAKKLSLHSRKRVPVPLFLAVSDLLNGIRKYIILFITFILGTILIILPINTINTLTGEELLNLFNYAKADIFVIPDDIDEHLANDSLDEFLSYVKNIEDELHQKDIDVSFYPEINFSARIYVDDEKENKGILAYKSYGIDTNQYAYLEGTAPVLANEVALTKMTAEYLGVGIGDSVHISINGITYSSVVTALFQSMNNLGYGCRLSQDLNLDLKGNNGFCTLDGFFHEDINKEKSIEKVEQILTDAKVKTAKEYACYQVGNLDQQIVPMRNLILIIVIGINVLITVLVVRLISYKELPEIALMKSQGYRNASIWCWQLIRIGLVIGFSIIMGMILSGTAGNVIAGLVFSAMGATRVSLTIKPLEVYLLYPAVIFIFTVFAAAGSLGIIKKVKVWEINNQE